MASFNQGAGENRLLATLAGPHRRRLLADFDQVELRSGEVICISGERLKHVYFPTDGIISLVTTLRDGSRLEVGSIGHEGMQGSSLILGVNTSAQHATVQRSGTAWRLGAAMFRRHLGNNIALRQMLNCYMYVLMGQLAQATACSHYHQVRARLARRLLMNRDQARGNQFHVTQEFLAHMLGVRRVGVTNAANSLREEGLIDYRRGAVTILDGPALELASCACYRGAKDMYEGALGSLFSTRLRHAGAPA
ncbi:Crp/Fnr family transcriptional regulator [Steroidobacter sp. S1-65]|uniref:Crp/Fnr family transcriptional regulator n=1 Tax=Steroidobacter gossypii TaxID=2805490 RepID=A0ABS1WQ54_9GAMM|nr:Crp/Fnr family transcriptional regulator [Steroidobacter gossypii]MBM0103111.1 Crp/Fnr family transcriptional regulator [Steroidobacter gossypii]